MSHDPQKRLIPGTRNQIPSAPAHDWKTAPTCNDGDRWHQYIAAYKKQHPNGDHVVMHA